MSGVGVPMNDGADNKQWFDHNAMDQERRRPMSFESGFEELPHLVEPDRVEVGHGISSEYTQGSLSRLRFFACVGGVFFAVSFAGVVFFSPAGVVCFCRIDLQSG